VHDGVVKVKSVITHATLDVRKAKLNPVISLTHEKAFLQGNAKYSLKLFALKIFLIPKGILSHTPDNLCQTPTRVVIGIIALMAFNGSYKANPFYFEHFDLTYSNVSAGGRTFNIKPLAMDYGHTQYVTAFSEINLAIGLIGKDAGNDREYRHFKNGYALYAFDLCPSLLDGDQLEMVKADPLSIELNIFTITPYLLQVIVYTEKDSISEISKIRQVLTDYSVRTLPKYKES
jgi:hypothetical protein